MRKVVLLALLPVLLLACSSKGGSKSAESTTTTTIPALTPEQIDITVSPFCATWADIRRLAGADIQKLDTTAIKAHYEAIVPFVQKLIEASPADLTAAARSTLDATQAAATLGSAQPFEEKQVAANGVKLQRYAYDHCRKKA